MDSHPPILGETRADETEDLPHVFMTRRTKICIWIIFLGLLNFLVYSVVYFSLPGEAIGGYVRSEPRADGTERLHYSLRDRSDDVPVSRGAWIYSAVHSTTIPMTVGSVLLAMLTLAKDRIVSSLRSSIVRGRLVITLLAAVVTISSAFWMILFLHTFINQLRHPGPFQP